MEQLIQQLQPYILGIATTLITFFASWLALKVRLLLDTQIKRTIVEDTVRWVEQVGKTLVSAEKLQMAKDRIIQLCAVAKIKITNEELETMIESFVLAFKDHYKENVENADFE